MEGYTFLKFAGGWQVTSDKSPVTRWKREGGYARVKVPWGGYLKPRSPFDKLRANGRERHEWFITEILTGRDCFVALLLAMTEREVIASGAKQSHPAGSP